MIFNRITNSVIIHSEFVVVILTGKQRLLCITHFMRDFILFKRNLIQFVQLQLNTE